MTPGPAGRVPEIGVFAAIGPELAAEMVERCRERVWRKGQIVSLEGDRATEALFVTEGQFKVTLSAIDGRELLVALRGRGEVIGELSLLDGAPRNATLTALSVSRAWAMPERVFTELMATRPRFGLALHVDSVRKLRLATARQLELGYDTVAGRVARRLVELAERFCADWDVPVDERSSGAPLQLTSPITQQELADWSGVTRQAVVKELTVLRDEGIISTSGSKFTIHDGAALEARAREFLG